MNHFDAIISLMSTEFSQLYKPDLYFGAKKIKGESHDFPELTGEEKVYVLGMLESCPEPTNMIGTFGTDWIIHRYTECSIVSELISLLAKEWNPNLSEQLEKKVPRKPGESPTNFEKRAVPSDYSTHLYSGSTAWGYSASRILIEQFGRQEPWRIGDPRVESGTQILKVAIINSHSPIEFLVNLATLVTQPNGEADPTSILGHLLAVELQNEGIHSQIKGIVRELKSASSKLWDHYLTLTPEQRQLSGILPIEVLE